MRLADFILSSIAPILQGWEDFARSVDTPGQTLDSKGLRNHAELILMTVALDMRTAQTTRQQIDKSQGHGPVSARETPAQSHAVTRLGEGFTMDQMVSEYRALRSSVLRLWLSSEFVGGEHHVADIIRFNEAIDQALVESIAAYGHAVETTRKMVLGVLGHDLRSPLGAVMMAADVMQHMAALGAKERQLALQISASVMRANQIVNDLLDLARCNLGTGIPVQREAVDLTPICASVVEELRTGHPKAQITFDEQGPVHGAFDPSRMAQVFSNLLANAIRHGDSHYPIRVTLGLQNNTACFTVQNGGLPIAPSAIPFLFNPEGRYSRYSNKEQGDSAGLGLGLFIASEIVKAHGGKIEVESTQERGTIFRVEVSSQA